MSIAYFIGEKVKFACQIEVGGVVSTLSFVSVFASVVDEAFFNS